jgi:hypothetical protein
MRQRAARLGCSESYYLGCWGLELDGQRAAGKAVAGWGSRLSTRLVRVPGVEPGSMASEATTLSIVLHSRRPLQSKVSPPLLLTQAAFAALQTQCSRNFTSTNPPISRIMKMTVNTSR